MSTPRQWSGPVVLNLGMGVDSVSLLTRWIHEPDTRTFDLDQLITISAMTGDEHDDTAEAMNQHVLPLMRKYRLRYVQLSRAGHATAAGITVLDDSRTPTAMHMRGPWALSDELAASGTLPPVARRACSQRAKGDVIDRWLAAELADTPTCTSRATATTNPPHRRRHPPRHPQPAPRLPTAPLAMAAPAPGRIPPRPVRPDLAEELLPAGTARTSIRGQASARWSRAGPPCPTAPPKPSSSSASRSRSTRARSCSAPAPPTK